LHRQRAPLAPSPFQRLQPGDCGLAAGCSRSPHLRNSVQDRWCNYPPLPPRGGRPILARSALICATFSGFAFAQSSCDCARLRAPSAMPLPTRSQSCLVILGEVLMESISLFDISLLPQPSASKQAQAGAVMQIKLLSVFNASSNSMLSAGRSGAKQDVLSSVAEHPTCSWRNPCPGSD
jgi:hypothetical protein